MTGNREILHRNSPAHNTITPPVLIQLRGQPPQSLKPGDGTGATFRTQSVVIDGLRVSGWALHVPWRNGVRGAVLIERDLDVSASRGIRFVTRNPQAKGDGAVLTVAWKPAGAPDEAYQTCYATTITSPE